jgi:TonB family protein
VFLILAFFSVSPFLYSEKVEKPSPTPNLKRSYKQIEQVITKLYLEQVKCCYRFELKKDPKLQGKVKVKFVINAKGNVVSVEKIFSTLKNELVEEFLLKSIKKWKFPKLSDDTSLDNSVTVVYTFVFLPREPEKRKRLRIKKL